MMLVRNCPLANSPKVPPLQGARLPDGPQAQGVPRGVPGREKHRSAQFRAPVAVRFGQGAGPRGFGVARFTVENSVECGDILDACFQGNPPGFDYTRGLFHRGVE